MQQMHTFVRRAPPTQRDGRKYYLWSREDGVLRCEFSEKGKIHAAVTFEPLDMYCDDSRADGDYNLCNTVVQGTEQDI